MNPGALHGHSLQLRRKVWGDGPLIRSTEWDFLDHSLHLRYALDAIRAIKGPTASILGVGCGGGQFIASVADVRPDVKCFGCDISKPALQIAKGRKGVEVEDASADRLPYEDGKFDAVFMIDVLEHLPNLDRGLREVRRVLKPGGVFHLVLMGDPL